MYYLWSLYRRDAGSYIQLCSCWQRLCVNYTDTAVGREDAAGDHQPCVSSPLLWLWLWFVIEGNVHNQTNCSLVPDQKALWEETEMAWVALNVFIFTDESQMSASWQKQNVLLKKICTQIWNMTNPLCFKKTLSSI